MLLLKNAVLKIASPLEREVGPTGRVGDNLSAFPASTRRLPHTPHPSMLRIADLPLKGGGKFDCRIAL
jgi:hypothetical protein